MAEQPWKCELLSPEGCVAIQNDPDRLEKWTEHKILKFNKYKRGISHLWRNNPMHQHKLGLELLGGSSENPFHRNIALTKAAKDTGSFSFSFFSETSLRCFTWFTGGSWVVGSLVSPVQEPGFPVLAWLLNYNLTCHLPFPSDNIWKKMET